MAGFSSHSSGSRDEAGCSAFGVVVVVVVVVVTELDSALSFHHVGSRDPTAGIRFGNLHPLSHLPNPVSEVSQTDSQLVQLQG